jgi:hypothetical protein
LTDRALDEEELAEFLPRERGRGPRGVVEDNQIVDEQDPCGVGPGRRVLVADHGELLDCLFFDGPAEQEV